MVTNLYELVQQRAETFPDAIALGAQRGLAWQVLNGRQLLSRVDGLAEELAARGIREGDRVVLWLPNHWRTPTYLFALWKLGAIVVPFDRETNPEAGAQIISSVEPRLIIAGYGERPPWSQQHEITEWWKPNAHESPPATWARPVEELAAAVFTSGTTGAPKGCLITHANLGSQIDPLRAAMPLDESCRLASVLPLSHLFELTCGLLYPLAVGSAIHYVPSRRGPDIVRVFREQRITHMVGVPQLFTVMGQAIDDQLRQTMPAPLLSRVRQLAARLPLTARRHLYWFIHRKLGGRFHTMVSGGAALPADTQLLWEQLGVRIVQGYGTSECSPVVACGTADGATPVGSVGRPLPGVEVKLTPEGELLVSGPNVMRGYWKDPDRTAEVLQDGWYATGDLARVDRNGNIWLQGRARDLIVLPSGMNLWPQDVEDVLRGHTAVKDAAVVAVPTVAGGMTLHAHLIPDEIQGQRPDLTSIVASCNARLAQHQRLATASWWPEPDFPRTSTLKVQRNLLPQPDAASTITVQSVLAVDDPVGQAIAGLAGVPAVQPHQTLAELGLDSLGLVELVVALEAKTGLTLSDDVIRLDMTTQQLRDALGRTATHSLKDGADGSAGELPIAELPLWPYTWGRAFRLLGFPIDLLYRFGVTRTTVLGGEHLDGLPSRVILAGTHHSFGDMPLVRRALSAHAPQLARRLVSATAAVAMPTGGLRIGGVGLWSWYSILALGLYPLQQRRDQEASLRRLVQIGEAGNPILIFPQGLHARPEQEQTGDSSARFRPGVAHLSRALGAAVVPFGVAGTEAIVPPFPEDFQGPTIAGIPASIRRGPLAVAFGAPLHLHDAEAADAFAARLQGECFRLTRMAERALPTKEASISIAGSRPGR